MVWQGQTSFQHCSPHAKISPEDQDTVEIQGNAEPAKVYIGRGCFKNKESEALSMVGRHPPTGLQGWSGAGFSIILKTLNSWFRCV